MVETRHPIEQTEDPKKLLVSVDKTAETQEIKSG